MLVFNFETNPPNFSEFLTWQKIWLILLSLFISIGTQERIKSTSDFQIVYMDEQEHPYPKKRPSGKSQSALDAK